MSIHKMLAARLHKYAQMRWFYDIEEGDDTDDGDDMSVEDTLNTIADEIMRGDFGDILGAREPTIEDVQREAVRVYGKHTAVRAWEDGLSIQVGTVVLNEPLYAPTIAAVYAALRTLPDYEGEK